MLAARGYAREDDITWRRERRTVASPALGRDRRGDRGLLRAARHRGDAGGSDLGGGPPPPAPPGHAGRAGGGVRFSSRPAPPAPPPPRRPRPPPPRAGPAGIAAP